MQVPIAGIASIDIKMQISSRLLGVEDGVARIQQVYTMDFGTAPAGMTLTADGSGGGVMLYDSRSKTMLLNESSTIMKMILQAPDGKIEMRMNAKQSQKLRTSTSPR